MVIPDFVFARIPHTIFGAGKFNDLAGVISANGKMALIVTGADSLKKSKKLDVLINKLKSHSIRFHVISVKGEPSPEFVDDTVNQFRKRNIKNVTAIGGGSVVDAGKAISAMLTKNDSVVNYLEGVGSRIHDGQKIPFIAVPTTAGTGSEATKNAVLSNVGKNGFKKSLRHDKLIPDITLIDPELAVTCPADITAACGMDAFTQLLESYVSPKASPLTDSLAYCAISYLKDNLVPACTNGANDVAVRGAMAYASYISGITLANAGLGIVHGLASPIGGYFDIPHGVVCGTLVGTATRMNIELLQKQGEKGKSALQKYARIGRLLSENNSEDEIENCKQLIEIIEEWTEQLKLPRLKEFEINDDLIEKIVRGTGIKNNPVQLDNKQINELLAKRI